MTILHCRYHYSLIHPHIYHSNFIAWGENFEQFLSALEGCNIEGPFWICALSIYQNEDLPELTIEKQLGPSPATGPFATVLKQAQCMLAIMTESCDIYTRLWCVYEIFIAISMNVPVSLATFNRIQTSGGGSEAMYTNVVLDSCGNPVVTSKAKCGMQADEVMIKAEIEKEGGFNLIDETVMWVRIKALIDDMPNAERKVFMESQVQRSIGTCSASNIATRQNAGIANAIKVWNEAREGGKNTSATSDLSIGMHATSDLSVGMYGCLDILQDRIFGCGKKE